MGEFIFGGAYLWASLVFGSKFTVFTLFYFVFESNFPSTSPRGLIFGGAYAWRGLFSEFYGMSFSRSQLSLRLVISFRGFLA